MELPAFQRLNPKLIPSQLKKIIEKHQSEILENLTQSKSDLMLLEILNKQAYELEKFWSPCSHLNAVIGSDEWRDCYAKCLPILSAHDTFIHQNEDLYKVLKNSNLDKCSEPQKKMLEDFIVNCELSGIALPKEDRKRVEQISERLDFLAQEFQNHIIDSQKKFSLHIEDEQKIEGIPSHILENAKYRAQDEHKNGYILSLDQPTYSAVLSYANDRELRKIFFKAYNTRASELCAYDNAAFDNTSLILEILKLREELAHLVGMSDYVEYSLKTKMAQKSSRVEIFLNNLKEAIIPVALQDIEIINLYAKNKDKLEVLEPWDTSYYVQKRQEDIFCLNQEALREYFPLKQVLLGINQLLEQLYHLHLEPYSVDDKWHPDVECLALKEGSNIIGFIYCDWFSRDGKRGGAWMDTLQTRCLDKGKNQTPITLLTCNFAKPIPGKEAGLTHDELLTLLHELGHCLHHLLSEVDEFAVSGVHGVEWDAVELPSQWMEHWGWQQEWVKKFSKHIETGESLPEAQFKQLLAMKNDMTGLFLLRQLLFAIYDFNIHKAHSPDSLDIVQNQYLDLLRQYAVWPIDMEQRFPQTFSHIFAGGYAAGYYSYLWADVLSCDVFEWFEKNMQLMSECGKAFRSKILAKGGSCLSLDAFKDLMGREPKQDALLRSYGLIK
jgi:oligopeptidase A